MKKLLALLVAAVMAAAVFGGCTPNDNPSSGTHGNPDDELYTLAVYSEMGYAMQWYPYIKFDSLISYYLRLEYRYDPSTSSDSSWDSSGSGSSPTFTYQKTGSLSKAEITKVFGDTYPDVATVDVYTVNLLGEDNKGTDKIEFWLATEREGGMFYFCTPSTVIAEGNLVPTSYIEKICDIGVNYTVTICEEANGVELRRGEIKSDGKVLIDNVLSYEPICFIRGADILVYLFAYENEEWVSWGPSPYFGEEDLFYYDARGNYTISEYLASAFTQSVNKVYFGKGGTINGEGSDYVDEITLESELSNGYLSEIKASGTDQGDAMVARIVVSDIGTTEVEIPQEVTELLALENPLVPDEKLGDKLLAVYPRKGKDVNDYSTFDDGIGQYLREEYRYDGEVSPADYEKTGSLSQEEIAETFGNTGLEIATVDVYTASLLDWGESVDFWVARTTDADSPYYFCTPSSVVAEGNRVPESYAEKVFNVGDNYTIEGYQKNEDEEEKYLDIKSSGDVFIYNDSECYVRESDGWVSCFEYRNDSWYSQNGNFDGPVYMPVGDLCLIYTYGRYTVMSRLISDLMSYEMHFGENGTIIGVDENDFLRYDLTATVADGHIKEITTLNTSEYETGGNKLVFSDIGTTEVEIPQEIVDLLKD